MNFETPLSVEFKWPWMEVRETLLGLPQGGHVSQTKALALGQAPLSSGGRDGLDGVAGKTGW